MLDAAVEADVEVVESKDELEDTCLGLISGKFRFDLGDVFDTGIIVYGLKCNGSFCECDYCNCVSLDSYFVGMRILVLLIFRNNLS